MIAGNSGSGGRSSDIGDYKNGGEPSPGGPDPAGPTTTLRGEPKEKKVNYKYIKRDKNKYPEREPGESNSDYNKRIKKFELKRKAAEGDPEAIKELDAKRKADRIRKAGKNAILISKVAKGDAEAIKKLAAEREAYRIRSAEWVAELKRKAAEGDLEAKQKLDYLKEGSRKRMAKSRARSKK